MIKIFDGGLGTMLQTAGLPPGYCPELWNIEHPETLIDIHRQYVFAGSNIITTNTFGANRIKLSHYNLQNKVSLLNTAAVQAARSACGTNTQIAGSIGPTGKFITPLGEQSFETTFDVYYEQIQSLDAAGIDMVIIETIIDIQEMRAALLAAKAATKKPIICQFSFGADGRTVTGTDPATAAITLAALGANVIGANCSLGPEQLLTVVSKFAQATDLPIIIQPNAGMPHLDNGRTIFPMTPSQMAEWAPQLVRAGASYIGACCGSTPAHIKAIRDALQTCGYLTTPPVRPQHMIATALTSRTKTVYLGANYPTVVIGERINPTGRKAMAADIRAKDFTSIKKEALTQLQAGAQILDVNMGVPGIDQADMMKQAVESLSVLVDAPLSIDTTDPLALEAGLRYYPGRALINSLTAEPKRLEQFLPLAKKYGAAVICLPVSGAGLPSSTSEKIDTMHKIINEARQAGLKNTDFILDALVLTLAANPDAGQGILETLRQYRKHFGFPTTMGLSNISYGLPRRDLLNASFCCMCLASGLDAPILNPYDPLMQDALSTSAVLLGHDVGSKLYIQRHAAKDTPLHSANTQAPSGPLEAIRQTVINGEKESVIPLIKAALKAGHSPVEITDKALTSAMNEVGTEFGAGRCYLPQVMLAAETMRAAFLTIKEALPLHSIESLGTILLATVEGDIHDLGKNIVAALMENNGFRVIDLGKDVSPQAIVDATQTYKPDIVGLCALMTTTLPALDETIKRLHAADATARIIVGGAVLTPEYAQQSGADAYAPDGVQAVTIAKSLLSHS